MQPVLYQIDYKEITILPLEISDLLGYVDIPEPVQKTITEVLDNAGKYCEIQGGYVIRENIFLDKKSFKLMINNTVLDVGKIIINQLDHIEKAAIFVCTAGKGIGEWSKEEMNGGDMLKGFIIDMAGSLIVDKAMDIIQQKLEISCLTQNLRITNRFSPGYCGWNVNEQHKLFSFLPRGFCGVRLTESALMYPIKSISGIIGIGSDVKFNPYTCNLCEMKDCIYRKRQK